MIRKAQKNEPGSAILLAKHYFNGGQGIRKDIGQGLKYLVKAAQHGDPEAKAVIEKLIRGLSREFSVRQARLTFPMMAKDQQVIR